MLKFKRRLLTEQEQQALQAFQTVLRIIAAFYKDSKGDVDEAFNTTVSKLEEYYDYGFMQPVKKWVTASKEKIDQIEHAKTVVPKISSSIPQLVKTMQSALMKNDVDTFLRAGNSSQRVVNALATSSKNKRKEISNINQRPLYIQDPIFFDTANFLRAFEQTHQEKVTALDPSKMYTYMPAPIDDNFQFFAYWCLELSDTDETATLSKTQMQKYIRIKYKDNPVFVELVEEVKNYLYDNNKSRIDRAVALLNKFKDLKRLQQELNSDTSVLYRGINMSDDEELSYAELYAREMEQKYVATTDSEAIAKRFATKEGTVLNNPNQTPGWVITYNVDPKDIVIDTQLFGTAYGGEREIIINPKKAKLSDADVVYPRNRE